MSKTIRFNSTRMYNKDGQIIRVKELPDGRFLFIDEARGVDGIVDPHHNRHVLSHDNDVIRYVMHAYDHLNYGHGTGNDHELISAFRKEELPEAIKYQI